MTDGKCNTEQIYQRINENSNRLTRLETLFTADSRENKETHKRIEQKVDEVADLMLGFRWMIKGAQWVGAFVIALGIWVMHEWHVLKNFFWGQHK